MESNKGFQLGLENRNNKVKLVIYDQLPTIR